MSKQNPNSNVNRIKKGIFARWLGEDYPGAEPRFFWQYLARDIGIFVMLPILAIVVYRAITGPSTNKNHQTPPKNQTQQHQNRGDGKSQIIDFAGPHRGGPGSIAGVPKRSPGTLVKLKLQNVVETYSTAPVHAQIVDTGLGNGLMGGSLIGDATPDSTYNRITINFRFVRDPSREGVAYTIAARALSLDGTLGIIATKKEGFVTRSVLGSAAGSTQNIQTGSSGDFKDILLKALTSGLFQEFNTASTVEQNRAQVLSLQPGTDFFAELTDYFPGASK